MTPNYVYRAFYKDCWGERVEVLVDLGFGRSIPMFFGLCDVAPSEDCSIYDYIGYIDTWMREDRRVLVESVRGDEHYEAHIYRGDRCLNVDLRESGLGVPA